MNFSHLNPDDFKRWIKKQSDFEVKLERSEIVGQRAETRFGASKIMKHAVVEKGKPSKVVSNFIEEGGIIAEVNEDDYLIDVKGGTFSINKRYVIV